MSGLFLLQNTEKHLSKHYFQSFQRFSSEYCNEKYSCKIPGLFLLNITTGVYKELQSFEIFYPVVKFFAFQTNLRLGLDFRRGPDGDVH